MLLNLIAILICLYLGFTAGNAYWLKAKHPEWLKAHPKIEHAIPYNLMISLILIFTIVLISILNSVLNYLNFSFALKITAMIVTVISYICAMIVTIPIPKVELLPNSPYLKYPAFGLAVVFIIITFANIIYA